MYLKMIPRCLSKLLCQVVPYIKYKHNIVAYIKYLQIMLKTIEICDMSTHCLLGKTRPFIIIVGTQTCQA